MELVRAFFRKKKTKIYLIIFSFIILGLILIYSLINYYDVLVNDYFKTNLTIAFVSNEDYYDELMSQKEIDSVKIGKIIKPNFSNKTLIKSSEESNFIMMDGNDYFTSSIYWDNFLIDDNVTVVYSAHDYNVELSDDEMILAFSLEILNSKQKEHVLGIIGKKLSFFDEENNDLEYKIKEIMDIPIASIIVSDKAYYEIRNDTKYYQITLSDYKQADNVRENILKLNYEKEYNVVKKSYDYSASQGMMTLISFLEGGGIIGGLLLFILLLIISNNILKDEKRNIYVERLLGFNRIQICKSIIVNMVLLVTFSTIIAIMLSVILICLLNKSLKMSIIIFDYKMVFLIFLIIEILSLLELIVFSLKINRCLKKDYMKI